MNWAIIERSTGKCVTELFDKRSLDKLNVDKYEAVPIQQYFAQINHRIKEGKL